MKRSFIIEVGVHRVRVWPYGQSAVGIELLDRPPPPPFPGHRPKVNADQKNDETVATEP